MRPVAELGLHPLVGDEESPVFHRDLRARERLVPPDDHRVRRDVGAENVDRLAGGDAEAPSLSRREAPEAGVAPDLAPVLGEDWPVAPLHAVAREKRAVIVSSEEARLLALGALGDPEAC